MDGISQMTFSNALFWDEDKCISFKILLFFPTVRINNIPALVQMMAWGRPSDQSLSEPMMVYWRTYASLGPNDLATRLDDVYEDIWLGQ